MSDRIARKVKWLFEISPTLRARQSLHVTRAQATDLAKLLCDAEDIRSAQNLQQKVLAATSGYDASQVTSLPGLEARKGVKQPKQFEHKST